MHFIHKYHPLYKMYFSFALFASAVALGIAGYMLLENYTFVEALYMTVITISTVGFTEVKPLHQAGQIFTIFLIIVNITIFTYFITVVSRFFLDGEFNQFYKQARMKKSIHDLQDHIIICGFGRNGVEAARIFFRNNIEFVTIERQMHSFADKILDLRYYLEADATHDDTLIEAGIKNAKALITTLPDDADNLFVVLTARELNRNLKIISRASNDSSVKKLKIAGADNVIMPDKIGGAHMASLILSPDVKEFIDVLSTTGSRDFQITELKVAKAITLKEIDCWNKTGATILGIKTHGSDYVLNPSAEMILQNNQSIIAMGSEMQLQKLRSCVS